MRIALYCRSACANETSLDLQEIQLRKYAVDRGDDIKSVIRETASGLSLKRPGLLSVCELAKSGEIDAVIAIGASRFVRDPAKLLILINYLRQNDVILETANAVGIQPDRKREVHHHA